MVIGGLALLAGIAFVLVARRRRSSGSARSRAGDRGHHVAGRSTGRAASARRASASTSSMLATEPAARINPSASTAIVYGVSRTPKAS